MKIAIDIRTAGGERAGKGWYTFHMVRNLLKQDPNNDYILYSNVGIPGWEEFPNATQKIISTRGILWHSNVVRDVKRENVDVFFAPSSYIIPALLPKTIKTIMTVHDLVAFLFPSSHNKKAVFIEKAFLKRALKNADHVVAVSKNTKRDIVNKFGYDEEKISITYCSAGGEYKPVPAEELAEFAEETNLPDKFFLAVGTIEPRKNYKNLIRAFGAIKDKYPAHHLIIVGNEGWGYEEVYKEIYDNYLRKRVHVLGYLSSKSLRNLYNLAEALVFPSHYEGFGIPPLEAMKCGCPVIVSNVSSIPEVVGDAGLYISPDKPEEIATAMDRIASDGDLRENLKNQGLLQSKKFSWADSARKVLEVIGKL